MPEAKTKSNRALLALRRIQTLGLGDRFAGMSKDGILKALKRTREQLWQEKLAARPRH